MGAVPYFSGETCVQSYEVLVAELSHATWTAPGVKAEPAWTGMSAPLDEQGYAAVAAIRSNHEMGLFVRRLAKHLGLRVTDDGGLNGVVPYYSGEVQTQHFDALTQEILQAAQQRSWIGPEVVADGTSASLDDDGYKAVAALRNDREMELFIRRAVTDLGCRVVDEGSLRGFVPYHSGTSATQTFIRLRDEILHVASQPRSWIVPLATAQAQPADTGTAHAVPAQAAPAAHLVPAAPAQAVPAQAIPAQAGSAQPVPAHTGAPAAYGVPAQAVPAQAVPAQAVPAYGQPAQAAPAYGQPVQGQPCQAYAQAFPQQAYGQPVSPAAAYGQPAQAYGQPVQPQQQQQGALGQLQGMLHNHPGAAAGAAAIGGMLAAGALSGAMFGGHESHHEQHRPHHHEHHHQHHQHNLPGVPHLPHWPHGPGYS
eukprot:gnl/TRDRNA2_/TRDRNA2_164219_c0_seq2.p1 gnl/TRDRNA2_/TRDRNA2_164219_c0~~gnl/TRDRNA2_/TRDRNA2_164219_c0_seq2.p1  ORF type:complete len:482 (-),score=91.22 gnl/TRDRNA2_/TRDRNA2_164219_c0_seq2:352-1623(-)